MGLVLVEIEEETYKEINDLMKKADANQITLQLYTELFVTIEMAVRAKKSLTMDANDMLLIDSIPIAEVMQEMKGRINE